MNRQLSDNEPRISPQLVEEGGPVQSRSTNASGQSIDPSGVDRFFDLALDMLCIAGMDGRFKRVNPSFSRTLGWSKEDLLDKQFVQFIHPDDVKKTFAEMERLAQGIPTYSFENRYQCSDGRYVDLSWTSFPEERSQLLYAVARDISEQKKAQRQLQRVTEELEMANKQLLEIATIDPLTRLSNRRKFDADAHTLIRLMFRIGKPVSLIMADIDHFKDFNDEHGHLEGDAVLKSVAKLLKDNKRESDVLARFGGEEFIMLLPDTASFPSIEVAENIRARVLGNPWPQGPITISIGVSTYCPHRDEELVDSRTLEKQLISEADKALYRAKSLGRNQVVHFDSGR